MIHIIKYTCLCFLLCLIFNNIQGQGGAIPNPKALLVECQTSVDQDHCRDSILLAEISNLWKKESQDVTHGTYVLQYMIRSNGNKEAIRAIRVPQQVGGEKTKMLLVKLLQNTIDEYEWLPIEQYEYKGIVMGSGVQHYLEVNTEEL